MNDVFLFLVCFSKGVSIPLKPRRGIPHIIPQALPVIFFGCFFLFFFLSFGTVDIPIWTAVGGGEKKEFFWLCQKIHLVNLSLVCLSMLKWSRENILARTQRGHNPFLYVFLGPHPLFKRLGNGGQTETHQMIFVF